MLLGKTAYRTCRWFCCLLSMLLSLGASVQAGDDPTLVPISTDSAADQLFIQARNYYQQRQLSALKQVAEQLDHQAYPLSGYVRYWQLLLQLNETSDETFSSLLAQYADYPFSQKIAAEWLKQLAKRQQWDAFFDRWDQLSTGNTGHQLASLDKDLTLQCLALQGRYLRNDTLALMQAKVVWDEQYDSPAACQTLFDWMQQQQILSTDDIWKKIRNSLRDLQFNTAKAALQRLGPLSAQQQKKFELLSLQPQALFQGHFSATTRLERELAIYALGRMAKRDWQKTQAYVHKISANFNADEQQALALRLATAAAYNLQDNALALFEQLERQGQAIPYDAAAITWKARAALRAKQWERLITCIQHMPNSMQQEPNWRYWLARAYREKRDMVNANAIWQELSKQKHFYGVLAQEELGMATMADAATYVPTSAEIETFYQMPAVQRTVLLDKLGLRWEARAEWNAMLANLSDKQLIAAADIAYRLGWLDVSIHTMEQTQYLHNDVLRYPMPFRDLVERFAQTQQIDAAWVYGLSRQESRFNLQARSGVGASGMMQVMPATAKWIAKRNGWKEAKPEQLQQVETNIQLGTYYLRYTLDRFSGQTPLATAAYNAGPSRVMHWANATELEGAIYAETIPIVETRLYVQKVMLNTYRYAQRLGKSSISLKQLLGKVSYQRDGQYQEHLIQDMME